MMDTTGELLETYYDTLKEGMASFNEGRRLRAILAPDLVFEGPIAGRVVGAERFIKGVLGFVETMQSLHMLHQLRAGDEAATLYDAEMPGGTVRFAEFFRCCRQDPVTQAAIRRYRVPRARGPVNGSLARQPSTVPSGSSNTTSSSRAFLAGQPAGG